jgi:hypothetical protein
MRAGVADCIIANGAAPASLPWDGARAKNRKGRDRFGSVDLIRLLARRTRSVDWRFACAVGPMDDAGETAVGPMDDAGEIAASFAACTARLSASEQTGHHAQFKSWRGVAAWRRPRDGPSPNGLAAFRSTVRAGLRAGSGPCLLGCNHADCFWGTGAFRATSRANLSALNRAVFSRVAKRAASYSAVAF